MSKNHSKIAREILSKELRISKSKIKTSTSILNNPRWDSLAHINIIISIEKKVKKKLSLEEISKIENFKHIIGILKKFY